MANPLDSPPPLSPREAFRAMFAAKWADGNEAGYATLSMEELADGVLEVLTSKAMMTLAFQGLMAHLED